MTVSPSRQFLAVLFILVIVMFYVGGSAVLLELASFKDLVVEDVKLQAFGTAYAPFLTWIATSYAAMAVSLIMALLSLRALRKLSPKMQKTGLLCFGLISGISIVLLVYFGNAAFDIAADTLCKSQGFCGNESETTPFVISEGTKTGLNAVFQLAAIGLLCGFIFSLADSYGDNPDRQKSGVTLFYCAALLLTLIVLTDLLFYEFMAEILPPDSSMLAYQKGFVIYFAIISSATLAVSLVAALYLGLRSERVFMKSGEGKNALASISALIGTATISRSLATLTPVIVTLIAGFAETG